MQHNPVDPRTFRRACSAFTTGVTVTTLLDSNGMPQGVTLSSFTSVSLDPPLILVCVDYRSKLMPYFQPGQDFGVNVLREGQEDLSLRFSRGGTDRFQRISWYLGQSGVPLISDVLATFECRLIQSTRAGDHFILLGEVLYTGQGHGDPLVYFRSSYQTLTADRAVCA